MKHGELNWLLFDADHTLFDFDRSARISLETALASYGVQTTPAQHERYFQINKMCWQEYEQGKIDRHTLARKRFDIFFEEIGVEGIDTVEFNDQYLGELPKHPYFLEDAPALLETVQKTYKLGLITNGLQQVQRPRLRSSGIDRHFDFIVVSGEIGLAKPDPAFFDHAHRAMDHPDKQSVMVIGDGLYSDMRGGINYGYRTCWYNPTGYKAPADIKPDHEIRSHADLISLLGLT